MPYLTLDKGKVFYAQKRPRHSEEPAVLFVHGAGGNHQHWLAQMAGLGGVHTLAPDLPGHGRTDGPGFSSIREYGDWLLTFMTSLGLCRSIIVGHSMGGAIALNLALRHQSQVTGLVLIATGARLRVSPALLDTLRENPARVAELLASYAYGPDALPEVIESGRHQIAATDPLTLLGDFLACDAFDERADLSRIVTPALVLCGTNDLMTPLKYSTYLSERISGSTLQAVEGAGHMVMLERPDTVTQAIDKFLRGTKNRAMDSVEQAS